MLNKAENPKSEYDKRSHADRVEDLRNAFNTLKAEAKALGKKNIASAAQVLKQSKVNKAYFKEGKLKNPEEQEPYLKLRDEIKKFKDGFDAHHPDSAFSKLEQKAKDESERAESAERYLEESRTQLASLRMQLDIANQKLRGGQDSIIDLSHQAVQASKKASVGTVNFAQIAKISPDKYLYKNGSYTFEDESLRASAWAKSEKELERALSRALPTRVYILIGPPSSGKTQWTENSNSYWPDRHPVVIDATNLTSADRLTWRLIINQFIRTNDIKTCAVIFDVPEDVIFSRNNNREFSKKLTDTALKNKIKSMEWPDLKTEKFDEAVVVRNG
jgi:hypothetical protein